MSLLALALGLATVGRSYASDPAASTPTPVPALPVVPVKAAGDSRLDGTEQRTRFIIGLERKVDFHVSSLPNPNRVVVDLPNVQVQLPQLPHGQAVGLVKSFRGGLSAPGRMRLVIEVAAPVIVEKATVETVDNRARLVLEIIPADPRSAPKKALTTSGLAKLGAGAPPATADSAPISAAVPAAVQPPTPKPAKRPEARAATAYKPIIVLDPGHGGHDSGAIRHGAVEKDVVLAFSLVLKSRLEATGRYKVLMTRSTDKFIPLHERREFGAGRDMGEAESEEVIAQGVLMHRI
ncbi:MAG TPA: N-acetylmuramoyl-L-alanine amidase, partial [Hyphomicrobiaceae bacterium]|nr:N-acetylmuramoyl-L-alanine amidase [Hyphomicrobiaceae bacterium]